MVAIAHYDVHTDTWIRTAPDARTLWRNAVQAVAEKAKDALPESHGRLEAAVKLVLAGDVELLKDGTAKVASQSNGTVKYYLVNGECQCKDFAKAPANFCKHRLAYGIAKRARAQMADTMQAHDQTMENGQLKMENEGASGHSPLSTLHCLRWGCRKRRRSPTCMSRSAGAWCRLP